MKGDNPLNRMASFCNAFFRLKPFNELHAWITMAHWTEVWNTCKSTSKFFLSISLLWHFQSNKVWFSEGLTIKTALKFTRALKYSYMLTEHASLYAQSQRIEFDFQSEWLKKCLWNSISQSRWSTGTCWMNMSAQVMRNLSH